MKNKLILSLACLVTTAAFAFADSITVNDGVGTANAGTYTAGQTFQLAISVNPTNPPEANVIGFSYWFETSALNSSFFTITAKNLSGSPFSDPNQTFTAGGEAIVPGGNQHDLGGTLPDVTTPLASGQSYSGGLLTLQIAANTPAGVYTISTTTINSPGGTFHTAGANPSEITDGAFAGHQVVTETYTITVVPEPATWSLFGLGGIGSVGLTWLRARRRS
jgi:PEP-CTERM motif